MPVVDRFLRGQKWMDPLAKAIQKLVVATYRLFGPLGTPLKNIAHGTWVLHHPLHPALTDVPLGAWMAGVVADYVALRTHLIPTQAGDIALMVGLVAAAGAVLTGYTDFQDTHGLERRAALLHGLVMSTVFVIELASLVLRWIGGSNLHGAAVGLATAGLVLAMFGMYLGGHLVFAFGTMINRNAFAELPSKFTDVGASTDFPEGGLKRVEARGVAVLVVRLDGDLYAIAATCSHAGGPLDEGTLTDDVVTCPWHGSQFCVRNGAVLKSPATFAQPALTVREDDGRVLVKAAK
ncbi:MAG TPA: Rieske 2Fe-2S domain-containing protein [Candidatus Sulfotelmatobacter sp.]|nr:Rieske 2Fe-2S domain-containing protein [Candidatus Sulfotelmatobacter sp.]